MNIKITNTNTFKSIYKVNAQYLTNIDLPKPDEAPLMIESPMGTGKTAYAIKYITKLEEELGREAKVLIITHRVTLAENMARRYQADCYLNVPSKEWVSSQKLTICINSLHKLASNHGRPIPNYDVLVIDECEQLASHICGTTFKANESVNAVRCLEYIIKNAGGVILMDAYPTSISDRFYSALRGFKAKKVVNTYQVKRKPLKLYHHYDDVIQDIKEKLIGIDIERQDGFSVDEIPTIVLVCDEKQTVKEVGRLFKDQFPLLEIQCVHSDNSETKVVQEFLGDVNNKIKQVHLLITSPTMGTGLDITSHVGHVFGLFKGNTITPEDMMQMLNRYRNVEEVTVSIPNRPASDKRTTNYREIYNDYQDEFLQTNLLINGEGYATLDRDQKMVLGLYATTKAAYNNAMNSLYVRLIARLKQRYIVNIVATQPSYETREELSEKRKLLAEEWEELVLNSQPVSEDDKKQYGNEFHSSPELRAGYERWQVEQLYGQTITKALFKLWNDGKGATSLYAFMELHKSEPELYAMDVKEDRLRYPVHKTTHRFRRNRIIHEMLANVFGPNLHTRIFQKKDLDALLEKSFKPLAIQYEKPLRVILGRRRDKPEDMLLLLQFLVRKLGLSFIKLANKKNEYQLDPESLELMRELAQSHIQFHEKNLDVSETHLRG